MILVQTALIVYTESTAVDWCPESINTFDQELCDYIKNYSEGASGKTVVLHAFKNIIKSLLW